MVGASPAARGGLETSSRDLWLRFSEQTGNMEPYLFPQLETVMVGTEVLMSKQHTLLSTMSRVPAKPSRLELIEFWEVCVVLGR